MSSAIEIISRSCLAQNSTQLGHPRHRAVVVDDLAEHAGRVQPGHAGQVDGRLGVAGPLEHAAVGVAQREDVAGPGQVAGAGGRVDERSDGGGPVGGRDAGRGAVAEVDAVGERGALGLGVVADHERDVELVEALAGERRADDARGVAHEEGDLLGRGRLGRHDEVALVLAVLVVDHHDDLAPADGGDRVGDGGEAVRAASGFGAHGVRSSGGGEARRAGRSAGARCTWRSRRPRGSPVARALVRRASSPPRCAG